MVQFYDFLSASRRKGKKKKRSLIKNGTYAREGKKEKSNPK